MTTFFWVLGYFLGVLLASLVSGLHFKGSGRENVTPAHIFGPVFWPAALFVMVSKPIAMAMIWPFAKVFCLAAGKQTNVWYNLWRDT